MVLRGIIAAWIASAGFIWAGEALIRRAGLFRDATPIGAMGFAMLLAALALAAGIGRAARTRHFESNIDGSRPAPGAPPDLTLRYVANTTEQLPLLVIACLGAGQLIPDAAQALSPAMAVWLLIARAAFFTGYRRDPLKRAFGFAATFFPTAALILCTLAAAALGRGS